MKYLSIALALTVATATSPSSADTKYRGIVSLLTTKDDFQQFVLAGTENGVNLTECEMRVAVWKEKNATGFDIAIKTLKEQGKTADLRITCERMNDKQ